MFDKARLKDVLINYKKDFLGKWWKQERYKWEAVKCFQDNWDINADDFYTMLHKSLAKTYNHLASQNYYPRDRMERFAKSAPEDVRSMFNALYDESKDVYGRMDEFKQKSEILIKKYGKPGDHHYQDERAMSVYLWLRYPDKYYIYKPGVVKSVANELKNDYAFIKGRYADNIRNWLLFYNEINKELKKDAELINLLKSNLTDTCYPDSELKTLTTDIGFYIYECKKHPNDFGKNADSDSEEKGGIKSDKSTEPIRYWLYAPGRDVAMWEDFYNRGVMGLGWHELGDLRTYSSKDEMCDKIRAERGEDSSCKNSAKAVWQFVHDVKIGDVVFVKRGRSEIIGRGIVADDYEYDENDKSRYPNIRKVKWTRGYIQSDETLPLKTLTDITECTELIKKVDSFFEDENEDDDFDTAYNPPYTESDFLHDVYMTAERYKTIIGVLKNKRNIILQGAPGVGKTFAAKRMAWAMMGERDESRVEFVQFHQNYSYEDFVMGYKPVKDGFELKYGVFYRFCKEAGKRPDKDFFFIIDEINRGNMSKIFGELLMLIENDYRGTEMTLAYNGEGFSVPKNLYIIGMMNTADRSLAMIDYALRRRFSFIEMEPAFDSVGFTDYQKKLNSTTFDKLIDRVKDLNREIAKDKSLGKGFCIGHSYFCGAENCTDDWLRSIVDYDIIPMLSEYWFDDEDKAQYWTKLLRGVFDDKE